MSDTVSDDFAQAKPYLRPRPVGMVPFANRRRFLRAQGAESALDQALEFVADIAIGAYSSLETTNVPVSGHQLETWNQSLRDVLDAAVQNAPQEEATLEPYRKALHVSGDTFGVMVLTMPGVLEQITEGRPAIVLLPTVNSTVIGFIDDPESLADAADAAEQLLAQSANRTVSIVPLYRHDGVWASIEWPVEARAAYTKLEQRWRAIQYSNATELLRDEPIGEENAIANYTLMESPSGERVGVASIMEGVNNLVPPCDIVGLVREDGTTVMVQFAELASIDGLLEPVDGLIPAYLRVTRFPSELVS